MSRSASLHRLGGLQRAPAAERSEPREQRCSRSSSRSCDQSIVARSVACARVGVARAFQRVEPVPETLEQLLGREQLRPGGCQLDRQRELVESVAEVPRPRRCPRRVRPDSSAVLAEERHRLVTDEGGRSAYRLARSAAAPGRRDDARAGRRPRARRGVERRRGASCSSVVPHEWERRSPMRARVPSGIRRRGAPRRSAIAGSTSSVVAKRRERPPKSVSVCIVAEQPCQLDRKSRLAGSARADERHHSRVVARRQDPTTSAAPARGRETAWRESAVRRFPASAAAGTLRSSS